MTGIASHRGQISACPGLERHRHRIAGLEVIRRHHDELSILPLLRDREGTLVLPLHLATRPDELDAQPSEVPPVGMSSANAASFSLAGSVTPAVRSTLSSKM
ncbi:hypothetical protein ACQ5SK_14765 [Bradyrhizobium japonicum]